MIELDCKVMKILYRNSKRARIKEIKKQIDLNDNNNIRYSTIDSCLKRLENEGFIKWEKYKPIILTEKGTDFTKEIIRHAQLLEIFLFNELGLTVEQAHNESEKFNLNFSCDIISKICEKYQHPEKCPCGEKILNSNACFCIEK